MQTLEHWAHRLFPKMTFGEVLERTERLGAKKEVQVTWFLNVVHFSCIFYSEPIFLTGSSVVE